METLPTFAIEGPSGQKEQSSQFVGFFCRDRKQIKVSRYAFHYSRYCSWHLHPIMHFAWIQRMQWLSRLDGDFLLHLPLGRFSLFSQCCNFRVYGFLPSPLVLSFGASLLSQNPNTISDYKNFKKKIIINQKNQKKIQHLAMRSSTRCLQTMRFRVPQEDTNEVGPTGQIVYTFERSLIPML